MSAQAHATRGRAGKFDCRSCGLELDRWHGRCPACQAWTRADPAIRVASTGNHDLAPPRDRATPPQRATRVEEIGDADSAEVDQADEWSNPPSVPISLAQVDLSIEPRISTEIAPLDRVLGGGGIVIGSIVLIGGDPGAGKSTLLAQAMSTIRCERKLYATGEESVAQAAMRASRVGAVRENIQIVPETDVDCIIAHARNLKAEILVVDSIQTTINPRIRGGPGSLNQVRSCTEKFMHFAKSTGTSTILVGHVTKDGAIAGPQTLAHLVDAVLHLAKIDDGRIRHLSASKNRFGSTLEVGGFEMTEDGLVPVDVDPRDLQGDGIAPIAQELLYRFLELGGEIDEGLRDRMQGRLDMIPRSRP